MATIREDVVRISFDVARNPFSEITQDINRMRASVTGSVASTESSIDSLTQSARNLQGTNANGLNNSIRQAGATA